MKHIVKPLTLAFLVTAIPISPALQAAPRVQQTQPDNTGSNKCDRATGAPTADQQSNDKADLERSQQIRRAITSDKTLSTYAHNIKVITKNGKVTLRGPVRDEAEKAAVEAKATSIAGAANVVSEVTVAPAKSSTKKSH
jgi:hyperosmotically inducible periplasmic protein